MSSWSTAHQLTQQAADWWIEAGEAVAVFEASGIASQVTAVRAGAHALPFGKDSFDAIVSIGAFGYFGTADSCLPCLVAVLAAWRAALAS